MIARTGRREDLDLGSPGAIVCRRLSAKVAEVAPPGLGRWERAWEIVTDLSAAFMDRLREWEEEDTEETRAALVRAGRRVVDAWIQASNEWERAGSPTAPPEEKTGGPRGAV